MRIESPAFQNRERIPSKFTCDGQNINPPLRFSEVPEEARSLVLISDDPDAPMGTWVHWTLWNIPPETREIAEDSVPEGSVQGATSFGKPGYGGPCPPSGTHRYFFKLFALKTKLDIPPETKADELERLALNNTIEKAEFYGTYNRA